MLIFEQMEILVQAVTELFPIYAGPMVHPRSTCRKIVDFI